LLYGGFKKDTETKALQATVFCWFSEPLDQFASVGFNHPLRCKVVGVSDELHVRKPLGEGLTEQ
jgi:hypothetical protein